MGTPLSGTGAAVALALSASLGIANLGGGSSAAPVVLYTDIISGSATNGEYGAGSYFWLYGYNFGAAANLGTAAGARVYINGIEVANYRALVPAVTNGVRPGFPPLMALAVQVGSAGIQALPTGSANPYAFSVIVNGVASNAADVLGNAFQFVIQPGHFWWIDDVLGNDATGVVDDIAHPFKYEQNFGGASTGGPLSGPCLTGNLAPGDTFVRRGNGGAPITEQEGEYGTVYRWNTGQSCSTGTAPTGTAKNGYVHFTAYPGPIETTAGGSPTGNGNAPEDVYFETPDGGEGGFMGSNTAGTGTVGQYWTVSNFRFSCAGTTHAADAAPIGMQNGANFTRYVNNNIQWPTTSGSQLSGGIAGAACHDSVCYGNLIQNILGGTQNHAIYYGSNDTACSHNVEIAFNVTINSGGQNIQIHDSNSGPTTDCFYNLRIHHNWCETAGKYNFSLWGPGNSIYYWNNVLSSSQLEAMFWTPKQQNGGFPPQTCQVYFENNTIVNSHLSTSGAYPNCIANESGAAPLSGGFFRVNNNIFAQFAGRTNTNFNGWIATGGGETVGNNIYHDDAGLVTSKFAGDSTGIYANPLFVSATAPTTTDVRLQFGSPAIGFAIAATINPVNDLGMNPQPRAGQTNRSVGAFA